MNGYVTISRAGDLYLRLAVVAICAVLLFIFGWIGRRVLWRRYPGWVKLSWVLGVSLSAFGVFMATLTM